MRVLKKHMLVVLPGMLYMMQEILVVALAGLEQQKQVHLRPLKDGIFEENRRLRSK